jgi:hypothetical protein
LAALYRRLVRYPVPHRAKIQRRSDCARAGELLIELCCHRRPNNLRAIDNFNRDNCAVLSALLLGDLYRATRRHTHRDRRALQHFCLSIVAGQLSDQQFHLRWTNAARPADYDLSHGHTAAQCHADEHAHTIDHAQRDEHRYAHASSDGCAADEHANDRAVAHAIRDGCAAD